MIFLNFAHPLTEKQMEQAEDLTGQPVAEVRGEIAQFDPQAPFDRQVRGLADRVGLSPEEWQTTPLLVNPPGYAPATAALLAELHGRTGHFPAVLRLRPVAGRVPATYEIAEVMDLRGIREDARKTRLEK